MCRRRFWILALLAVAAVIVFAGAVAALSHLSWWHSYRMRGPIGRGWSQILPMRPWLHRPGLSFHRTWAGFPALLCGLGLLCPVGVALLLVALLVGLFHRRSRGPGLGPAGRSWHEHVQRHDVPGHGAEHEESFNAKVSPGQRAEESPGNKPDES